MPSLVQLFLKSYNLKHLPVFKITKTLSATLWFRALSLSLALLKVSLNGVLFQPAFYSVHNKIHAQCGETNNNKNNEKSTLIFVYFLKLFIWSVVVVGCFSYWSLSSILGFFGNGGEKFAFYADKQITEDPIVEMKSTDNFLINL